MTSHANETLALEFAEACQPAGTTEAAVDVVAACPASVRRPDTSPRPDAALDQDVLELRARALAVHEATEAASETVSALLFSLGEETYGVRLADVREIQRDYSLTRVPCVPDFVLGVVSVRGEVVSVNDLARMMQLSERPVTPGAVRMPAIVLQTGEVVAAIVVDDIGDIADIPTGSIDPPLSMAGRVQGPFLNGTAFVEGRLVGLIDVKRVLEPVAGPT
jgi:purine-binding chemotaxis protein CheW